MSIFISLYQLWLSACCVCASHFYRLFFISPGTTGRDSSATPPIETRTMHLWKLTLLTAMALKNVAPAWTKPSRCFTPLTTINNPVLLCTHVDTIMCVSDNAGVCQFMSYCCPPSFSEEHLAIWTKTRVSVFGSEPVPPFGCRHPFSFLYIVVKQSPLSASGSLWNTALACLSLSDAPSVFTVFLSKCHIRLPPGWQRSPGVQLVRLCLDRLSQLTLLWKRANSLAYKYTIIVLLLVFEQTFEQTFQTCQK